MSEIIQFLEAVGREPALSPAEFANSVAALQIPEAQRQALLEGDSTALGGLLEGRSRMICLVNAPLDDEEDETDPDDRDGDGVPDDDRARQN